MYRAIKHFVLLSINKTDMKNNNILGMVALLWIMVMSMNHVVGQTYQIPTSGTTNVTGCSGIVQDPGGSGDYSNSCNGYLVITSDQTGCMPHISGSYNTESSFDYLYVYDGTTTSGTQLAYCTGTGTVDVTSTTGSLMLYFHSDGSVVRSGFELNLTCSGGCGCGGPVVTYSTSSGHILVNWNAATGVTHYFIEYGPHGFTPGNGTRTRVTGTSYNISGLTDGMQYDVYVWFDCGDDNQLTNEVGTMISATPNNIFFVPSSGNNSVTACNGILYDHAGPDGNYNNSCSGYTIIYPDEPTCVVHLEGSYNTESCCDHIYVYDGAGTGGTLLGQFQGTGTINVSSTTGPLTVQFTSDGSVVYSGFSLQLSCRGSCSCGGSPYGVTVVQGNTGVLVSWDAGLDPDVHNFIIEYGLSGFTPGTGTTVMTSDTSYELIGLTTLATYDIYIYYDCGGDNVITDETATIITFCVPDAVACIDFSDWSNPAITCTYGTFDNPYATVGVVDNGYASVESRHTINYINETDPRRPFHHVSSIPYDWATGIPTTKQKASPTTSMWTPTTQISCCLNTLRYWKIQGTAQRSNPVLTLKFLTRTETRLTPPAVMPALSLAVRAWATGTPREASCGKTGPTWVLMFPHITDRPSAFDSPHTTATKVATSAMPISPWDARNVPLWLRPAAKC